MATRNRKFTFEQSFASHEKAKYWSEKNDKQPINYGKNSAKLLKFECDICLHEFERAPCDVIRGIWCPICSNKQVCADKECKRCFENSFASHDKAKYWSIMNDQKPREVPIRCSKKFLFDCETCEHEFSCAVNTIVSRNQWCNYCNSDWLCKTDDCEFCYNKSFASHPKAVFWSGSNEMTPREVTKCSGQKYKFDCPICYHEFETQLNNESFCPYCSKATKRLCEKADCDFCFDKSFASHPKSAHWSQNNTASPREIPKFSNKKFIFDCPQCNNAFESRLSDVSQNKWCPICKRKTQRIIYDFLIGQNLTVKTELNVTWCQNESQKYLSFDYCVEEFKIIVELDGNQHFVQVQRWKSPELTRLTDVYKMRKALENGYTVVRILQEDVYYDRNDWRANLTKHLYLHETPECVFICDRDEYAAHRALLESDDSITIASVPHGVAV